MEKHRLIDIEEKPVQRCFVSAGIYVLEPKLLNAVPASSYFDMPDLFKIAIAKRMVVTTFPIREYWIDVGRMEDLERAKYEYPEVFE